MSNPTPLPPTKPVELSKEEKVFNLTVELIETKRLKKDSAKGFNDEIKRLQEEIEDILKDDKATDDKDAE